MDVASVDVIWNGFHQAKKIADLAETFEVNCAPHNYYSHLATFISAQWCAAIPNVRILEVDVDDVPWRDELSRLVPRSAAARYAFRPAPAGAPTSIEDVLRAHPWPEWSPPGVSGLRGLARRAGVVGGRATRPPGVRAERGERRAARRADDYAEDARPIADKRPTTAAGDVPDLTLVPEALGDVVDTARFRGKRVLEVGPKYGIHSRWIDRELEPSELVFSDFASDQHLHEPWVGELRAPHRFVYGDLR